MQPAPMIDDNEPKWPRLNVRDNREDKSRAMRNWIANICQIIYCKSNSTDIHSRWTLSHKDLYQALKKRGGSIYKDLLTKIDNFRGNYVLQTLVQNGGPYTELSSYLNQPNVRTFIVLFENIIPSAASSVKLSNFTIKGKVIRPWLKYMASDIRVATAERNSCSMMLISFETPSDYEWQEWAGLDQNLYKALHSAIRNAWSGAIATNSDKHDISRITITYLSYVTVHKELPLFLSMLVQERLVGAEDIWTPYDIGSELFAGILVAMAQQSMRFIQAQFLDAAEKQVFASTRSQLSTRFVRDQVKEMWNKRFYERRDGLELFGSLHIPFDRVCEQHDDGAHHYHMLFLAVKDPVTELNHSIEARRKFLEMRHIETKDGNNPIKAVMIQSTFEHAGVFHGYIYVANPMWHIHMLRDIETHLAKHNVGLEAVCINQLPAGSEIVNQIAQSCQTTITADGAKYEANEALDTAFFDDDCSHFRSDAVKQALVDFERMHRPSLLPRPFVYASGLAADAIEPFLEFQPIHAESVARETVPIENGAESLEDYGDRICNRKVGQEIRAEDPEPDWDFWFKVPDDMEPQPKKAKTVTAQPQAQAGMVEVAGGAGGSFYVPVNPAAAGPQAGASSQAEAGSAGPAPANLPSMGVIKTERDYEYKIAKMEANLSTGRLVFNEDHGLYGHIADACHNCRKCNFEWMTPDFKPSGQFLVVNHHNIWLSEVFSKGLRDECIYVVDLAGKPIRKTEMLFDRKAYQRNFGRAPNRGMIYHVDGWAKDADGNELDVPKHLDIYGNDWLFTPTSPGCCICSSF